MIKSSKKLFWITAAFLTAAVILFSALTVRKTAAPDVDAGELFQLILRESADPDNMKEGSVAKLKSLYGLDRDDYEAVFLRVPSTNMDAQELLLVRVKNSGETAGGSSASEALIRQVKDAARQRIEDLKSTFSSYGIDQMALIDNAVVDVRGDWCFYCSDKNSEQMRAAFRKALK